jgi:hypothetical protein
MDFPRFEIRELNFETTSRPDGLSGFNVLPPVMDYSLSKPEEAKEPGSWKYKLTLSVDVDNNDNLHGKITVKTNHPEKPEFVLNATLRGKNAR